MYPILAPIKAGFPFVIRNPHTHNSCAGKNNLARRWLHLCLLESPTVWSTPRNVLAPLMCAFEHDFPNHSCCLLKGTHNGIPKYRISHCSRAPLLLKNANGSFCLMYCTNMVNVSSSRSKIMTAVSHQYMHRRNKTKQGGTEAAPLCSSTLKLCCMMTVKKLLP